MGVCSDSLTGFSGVGNKNFSVLSGTWTSIKVSTYATTSSYFVRRLSAFMSTCRSDLFLRAPIFVVSSNCGRRWTVQVLGWSLLTVTDTWMIRVARSGMVCFPSDLMVMGLGLHFCISSVKDKVICIFGKSIVPCAVSRILECFRRHGRPNFG